jgi:hypothetical protein
MVFAMFDSNQNAAGSAPDNASHNTRSTIMLKIVLSLLLFLIVLGTLLAFFGVYHWQRGTANLRAQLAATQTIINTRLYDERELENLPAPVQRYFKAVLKNHAPIIKTAYFHQTGTFNMGETTPQWRRFEADQKVVTHIPGFDWNARISIFPGFNVYVHDAYVAGEGLLQTKLLGIFSMAHIHGTPEVAQGELMRYLSEAVRYPTALLPSQGVLWQAIDDTSARASLTDGNTSVSLDFHFNADGLVKAIHADSRARTVGGKIENAPWDIRVWNYQNYQGMRVPTEGEVAWALPDGAYPYWRGRVNSARYEFVVP